MFITVSEMAKREGVTVGTIRNRIRYGAYEAVQIGRDWRIWIDDRIAAEPTGRSKAKLTKHTITRSDS